MDQAHPDQYPDYHFLLIASNLGAEWFFDAARAYWVRFHPTVISDFSFIPLLPPDNSLIVTVIARRDTAAQLGVELAQASPNAYFDAVVYDLFDDAKKALDDRAGLAQPFGVPLTAASPNGIAPFVPTPQLPISNATTGFITQVPPT